MNFDYPIYEDGVIAIKLLAENASKDGNNYYTALES
jgi:hypothetical protein